MGRTTSRPSSADLKDLKSCCSNFSEKEIADFYSNFHQAYPKGRMTREQLEAMYARLFPGGDAADFARNVFRVIDADGDGTVDFREYLVSMSASLRGDPLETLRRAFSLYDVDGDGYITEDEMAAIFTSYQRLFKSGGGNSNNGGGMAGSGDRGRLDQTARSIIRQFDDNRDDRLSFDEFVKCAQKMPKIVGQIMTPRRDSVVGGK